MTVIDSMEPVSNVLGIIVPVCVAATKIAKAISAVRSSTTTISRLHSRITVLHKVLLQVEAACSLRTKSKALHHEGQHYRIIFSILKACKDSLDFLNEKLPPEGPSKPGIPRKIKQTIQTTLSQDEIKLAVEDINHYTILLGVSLSTISLLQTKYSTEEILQEVKDVSRRLRSNIEITRQPQTSLGQCYVAIGGFEVKDVSFARVVEEWTTSTRELAGEILVERNVTLRFSSPDPDVLSRQTPSDPALVAQFDQQYQYHKYQVTMDVVDVMIKGELFSNASQHLKEAVDIRTKLAKANVMKFDGMERQHMLENLAEIYERCETADDDRLALEHLKSLNKSYDAQDSIDRPGQSRLRHKIGKLYARIGELDEAGVHLQEALRLRVVHEKEDRAKVVETYEALQETHRSTGKHIEYNATKRWMAEVYGPVEDPSRGIFEEALAWAQGKGFGDACLDDMHLPKFDVSDSTRRTLLHVAVTDGSIKPHILEQIIENATNLEASDAKTGDTPLLAAVASSKDTAVKLLLSKGADMKAVDNKQRTILHKCQSEKMVELVYKKAVIRRPSAASDVSASRRPSTSSRFTARTLDVEGCDLQVDSQDVFGKTALYQACEKGQSGIVSVLLRSFKANPGILGPGGSSPLTAAIQSKPRPMFGKSPADANKKKLHMIAELVDCGADRKVPSSVVQKSGGLAQAIKGILGDNLMARRASSSTVASASTTAASTMEDGWTEITWEGDHAARER